MPRLPAQAPPSRTVIHFQETGEIQRRWAANNRDSGHPAEAWLAGPTDVPSTEDPADTARRNSLCGEPLTYETERICKRCGLIPGEDYLPRCPNCGRAMDVRRLVTRRAEPQVYGPEVRWEEREIEFVEKRDDAGQIKRNRKGEPLFETKTLSRSVKRGPWSDFRRAVADADEMKLRERLKVTGSRPPDRVFLLPGS